MLSNRNESGFSLLEVMIVLVLIVMLGAFVVPNIFKTNQSTQRKQFLISFEAMLKQVVLRSILKQEIHQIFFDIQKEVVEVRVQDSKSSENTSHKQFTQLNDAEYTSSIPFLKNLKIKNFFIHGSDEVVPGALLENVLFYIMPDGTSQPVIVNITEESEYQVEDISFSFIVNPFYARMSIYETFQTP